MILWRTSNYADLSGIGGLRASGRWHTRGQPIVYLAEHPAAALLELLVHAELDPNSLPETYQLLKIRVEDSVLHDRVALDTLPDNWKRSQSVTRVRGDVWLRERRTALLQVPSALTPETWNWLLNPRHADFALVRIIEAKRYPHDSRLLKK
jgi:RES domain-containing protein